MVDKVKKIWMDGEMVDWDKANVHILTHTLHYGLGAFEGIRAYKRADGSSGVFRLREHMQRLLDSTKIMGVAAPYDLDTLCNAAMDTLKVNGLDEAYIRPLVYIGDGAMGLYAPNNPVKVSIIVWKWGAYLGDSALENGIRARVSSYTRHHINASMPKGKVVGNYVNSIMAKREAKEGGVDEAIMLDTDGYVCEATGENIFIVQKGIVKTPPMGGAILGGITRNSLIVLLRELGYNVREKRFTRDEVWCADEVFMCGTAAEVTPVVQVDGRQVGNGKPGPVVKALQTRFFDVLRGKTEDHPEWITRYRIG